MRNMISCDWMLIVIMMDMNNSMAMAIIGVIVMCAIMVRMVVITGVVVVTTSGVVMVTVVGWSLVLRHMSDNCLGQLSRMITCQERNTCRLSDKGKVRPIQISFTWFTPVI